MDRATLAKRAAARLAIVGAVAFSIAVGADILAQLRLGHWGAFALILGSAVLAGALTGGIVGYWMALKRLNRS